MANYDNVTSGINVQAWPKMLQRNNHFLMDYYGLQANYSAIVAYAESNPAAAVGQVIYAKANDPDGQHPLGLYVIKSYGEGAEVEAVGTGVSGGTVSGAITVNTYESLVNACESEDNVGRIVILTTEVDNGEEGDDKKTYLPGLYIISGSAGIDSLEKISTSAADGSNVADQVSALNVRVGNLESVGAQANVIEGIKINGSLVNPVNKIVDLGDIDLGDITITKDSDSSSEFAAVYRLVKDGETLGEAINIPKDLVVSKGELITIEEGEIAVLPTPGNEDGKDYVEYYPAGKYIKLTLNNDDVIYINVADLASTVSGGVSSEISVSVDSGNVITASLVSGSIAEGKLDSALSAKINGKVDTQITGDSGRALIFNESDGGGAKFEHTDGTESFVGVHSGGENGMMAQIYADKYNESTGAWEGSTIKVYHDKIYYQNKENRTSGLPASDSEIATKGDISIAIANVEVKVDNSTIKKNTGGQLYVSTANLAVAGDTLGVVKNGGNIEVAEDGSMNLIWTEL